MPRNSGNSSAGSGAHPSFRGAEQSLHIMRQVKSYFNVGMDHVLEVAADMAESGKGLGPFSLLVVLLVGFFFGGGVVILFFLGGGCYSLLSLSIAKD